MGNDTTDKITLNCLLRLAKEFYEVDPEGFATESFKNALERIRMYPRLITYGPGASLQHEQVKEEEAKGYAADKTFKCFDLCGYCLEELEKLIGV